jgi:hypothetical protein
MRGARVLRAAAIAVALVTVLAGASVRRGGPAVPGDPALAAYLQMGGMLAELCGDGAGHGGDDRCPHCDGCRLLAVALPAGADAGARAVRFAPVAAAVAAGPGRPGRRLLPCGPRAPPAVPAV